MKTIYYDMKSGKLVKERVWQWCLPDAGEGTFTYGEESSSKTRDIHACPIEKRHVTDVEHTEVVIDVFGRANLRDLVPTWTIGPYVASQGFVDRLKKSGLSGWKERPIVKIASNQSQVKNPMLTYLEFTGKGGFDRRLKVRGADNLCPRCKKRPVICRGCGQIERECLACGKCTLNLPKAVGCSEKNGFLLDGYPPDVLVVEAKEWDGSDFFMCGGAPFINARAKDWLERTHAFPTCVQPALLNIEGAERQGDVKKTERKKDS